MVTFRHLGGSSPHSLPGSGRGAAGGADFQRVRSAPAPLRLNYLPGSPRGNSIREAAQGMLLLPWKCNSLSKAKSPFPARGGCWMGFVVPRAKQEVFAPGVLRCGSGMIPPPGFSLLCPSFCTGMLRCGSGVIPPSLFPLSCAPSLFQGCSGVDQV